MGAARKLKGSSTGMTSTGKVIIPAKLIGHKKGKTKRAALMGEGQDCACPPVSLEDGFWTNYDGNMVLMTGMPTSGGPWIPAIYPNGQTVWINGAQL